MITKNPAIVEPAAAAVNLKPNQELKLMKLINFRMRFQDKEQKLM